MEDVVPLIGRLEHCVAKRRRLLRPRRRDAALLLPHPLERVVRRLGRGVDDGVDGVGVEGVVGGQGGGRGAADLGGQLAEGVTDVVFLR